LGAKLAGYSTKLVLKTTAVPTIQVNPTPEQLEAARGLAKKRKKPEKTPKAVKRKNPEKTPKAV